MSTTGAVPLAVGRIDRGPGAPTGAAICTGALVARDLVLTAGHCLRGARDHPTGLRFTVGGIARRGVAVLAQPGALPDPAVPQDPIMALAGDLALLRLDGPVPAEAGLPLPFAAAGTGRFAVLAFRRDHPETAAAQTCARVVTLPEGAEISGPRILGLDCPVVSGNSGAPLLVATGTGWAIAGVVVAANRVGPVQAWAVVPDAALRALIAGLPAPGQD